MKTLDTEAQRGFLPGEYIDVPDNEGRFLIPQEEGTEPAFGTLPGLTLSICLVLISTFQTVQK